MHDHEHDNGDEEDADGAHEDGGENEPDEVFQLPWRALLTSSTWWPLSSWNCSSLVVMMFLASCRGFLGGVSASMPSKALGLWGFMALGLGNW